jgi:ABC-2 type transport system permease protein
MIVMGWGEYFPWSVPGLYASLGGKENSLPPISFWLVILTGIAGMLGTYFWWMSADQSR